MAPARRAINPGFHRGTNAGWWRYSRVVQQIPRWRNIMRALIVLALLSPLVLAACGSDEKTVVVNPQPGATVVVPPGSGATKVCPAGASTC